eukprot:CAMPEP_0172586852 /NCGR_PEP_ID=MMETSP1068-20121228/6087_1 /TAXON_ID=35684 /ORGANISM="Pseudopedinella elastica, Strain CCMP716" /LENGTH=160 /DNA_ID=CAMNT_0013381733 /DNA_START=17 /DNA_END=499 /DNA_ORIENTATION=-
MRKAAIYTVGRQLNDGEMYIFSLYDLEPAGILIRAYCQSTSSEQTTSPTENELEKAGLDRSSDSLAKLAESYDLVSKGGTVFLESNLAGINPPKVVPRGEGVRQYITATTIGEETLPELLTTALAELCKEKPAGLDAVRWLGQWLLDNNPIQPDVAEPED